MSYNSAARNGYHYESTIKTNASEPNIDKNKEIRAAVRQKVMLKVTVICGEERAMSPKIFGYTKKRVDDHVIIMLSHMSLSCLHFLRGPNKLPC